MTFAHRTCRNSVSMSAGWFCVSIAEISVAHMRPITDWNAREATIPVRLVRFTSKTNVRDHRCRGK
jgi:hypothetical protein